MIKIQQLRFDQMEKLENCTTKDIKDNQLKTNTVIEPIFPKTRYQGSKAKILEWIWENIEDIHFNSVLDVFGGTGCVSYMFKQKGKQVIYNDILKFNSIIGKALIENTTETLDENDVQNILNKHIGIEYPTFIQDNFSDIFYLDEENQWLDIVVTNIRNIKNEYKKSIAWFALFQACIIKRPYNLFHRKNLYVRTNEVKRSFGNKKTWDTSFEQHFRSFVKEANDAIFNSGNDCISLNYDALEVPINEYNIDLVYIDSPYISGKGIGTDYIDFYHFLEGMVNYDTWSDMIITKLKHKPLIGRGESSWTKKNEIHNAFDKLFDKYKNSTIVVSYRADGIPTIDEIINIMKNYKDNVECVSSKEYKYALAVKNSKEVLIIGR